MEIALRKPEIPRPALHQRWFLREGEAPRLLPTPDEEIQLRDQLLFVGSEEARKYLTLTLFNGHTLSFVLTGRDSPSGLVWEWLADRRQTSKA